MAPVQKMPQIKTLLESCLKEANPQGAEYIKIALNYVEEGIQEVNEAVGAFEIEAQERLIDGRFEVLFY